MDSRQWGRVAGVVGAVVLIGGTWWFGARKAAQYTAGELVEGTRTAETTPALTSPTMIPVSSVTSDYFDDIEGIAVEVNGDARFYSFQVLNWHEIVRDTVGGTPLTITYSTLCGSAAVYANTGDVSLSGQVKETCSVLKDGEGNLWLQPTGEQIRGKTVGAQWARVPSAVTRFADWYPAHPNGQVLSLQTGYERVYSRHPLGAYDTSEQIIGPLSRRDSVVPLKDLVWDVLSPAGERLNVGIARSLLAREGVLQAQADSEAIVAFMDNRTANARIYNATVNGQVLTWKRAENGVLFTDDQTGSTWNVDGEATRGELAGTKLTPIAANRMFGFAFVALFPQAQLPGYEAAKAAKEEAAAPAAPAEGETITVE